MEWELIFQAERRRGLGKPTPANGNSLILLHHFILLLYSVVEKDTFFYSSQRHFYRLSTFLSETNGLAEKAGVSVIRCRTKPLARW
jgi:hypothetical protein